VNSHNDLPICRTCGAQYAEPREDCPICEDERQYVGWGGQRWTSLDELQSEGVLGQLRDEGPGVTGIGTRPGVGIGQRALLVRSARGNVLWDCIGYLDEELAVQVRGLGGVAAIAISHPHFYGTMVEWAHVFEAPVYIHAADRQWVARPDSSVVYWEGDTREILPGMTLVNCGAHFEGGTVLHWREDPDGLGALFSGDVFQVVMDRRWVSFMYSFPNLIPERPSTIRRAIELIEPLPFERIYGAFWDRVVRSDGSEAVRRSAERYLRFALDQG
jgi:glyoxylase-like metal-dependent hydrolase (beta-lactamase superfamily II)